MRRKDESEKDRHDTAFSTRTLQRMLAKENNMLPWSKHHCREYYHILQSEWFSGARKFPM